MGKKRGDKWPTEYQYVVHATEPVRRTKYKGCVSRQTLRAQLRKTAFADIRAQYPGELHGKVRELVLAKAGNDYKALRVA